jgi:predicted MPP superfamily phosphohydrolase
MTLTRRAFASLPLLAVPPAAWAAVVEPGWLEFTERECRLPNLVREVNVVHLSDLHASRDVPNSLIEHAVDLAIQASPDMICVTGDFVTVATGFDRRWLVATLSRLAKYAPTYGVLGNHDGGKWSLASGGFHDPLEIQRLVEASGVVVLGNRSVRLPDTNLRLVGVHDIWSGFIDPLEAFRGLQSCEPVVLLSHNPDSKAKLRHFRWDLMLCGHTHGGQVVMPVLGNSPAPVLDRRYVAGLNRWGNRWIHTSRGVGNIKGIRFNCRPEVTRLRLVPV